MRLPLLKPMLAVASKPFDHPDYYYEVKWDGYRCLAYVEKNTTRLFSRNHKELTGAFPDLAGLHTAVDGFPLILDGEIIVMVEGKPSFDALQSRAGLKSEIQIKQAVKKLPAVFVVFDILYLEGRPMMEMPLKQRRGELEKTINSTGMIFLSEVFKGDGVNFYHACVEQGLEGIMAKKLNGKYLPGNRSSMWKKIRHTMEADLVICGFREGNGSRNLGALVLGAWNGINFVYQGMVGTGISTAEERNLLGVLDSLKANTSNLTQVDPKARRLTWVRPELVCKVEYLTLTREGYLRHPVYKGLRNDKDPSECFPLKKM